MAAHHPASVTSFTREEVTLDKSSFFAKLPIIGLVLALIGLGVTFGVGQGDKVGMYSAYVTSFMFWLSIAIGGYFFVTIFFLSRSAWNVTVRRIAENAMSTLPFFALLFIPIVLGMDTIYHWTHQTAVDHDAILQWKAPYLNTTWFLIRAVIYFVAIGIFAVVFYKRSTRQDETGDHAITRRLQMLAAPAIAVGALAATFMAVDWVMTTDPHWFSTMYGVYYFSGAMVGIMAFMMMIALGLRASNATNGAITDEHIHGMGMLLFGFNIFWTYIAFSQFFLIWYANIPEETAWFGYRFVDGWRTMSIGLILVHFIIPFFFLMPRAMKRNPKTVGVGAALLFVMHYVDTLWAVKPSILHANGIDGVNFGLLDIAAFVGVGGVFIAIVGYRMSKNALVAYRDPRLPESMEYANM